LVALEEGKGDSFCSGRGVGIVRVGRGEKICSFDEGFGRWLETKREKFIRQGGGKCGKIQRQRLKPTTGRSEGGANGKVFNEGEGR